MATTRPSGIGRQYDGAMENQADKQRVSKAWGRLAQAYADSRQVSADKLIEWPAQLRLAGEFRGKQVLDVGCGTGDKARFFAENGAASVIGVDPSGGFSKQWSQHEECLTLQLVQGSFENLHSLPALQGRKFDLVVCFQALMYAGNLDATVKTLAGLLLPDGALVFSVPHPFRFAILKNEMEGWGHGLAYQQTQPYRYPSPWNPEVYLEHAMPRVSDYLNAIASANLRLASCEEPCVTDEFRAISPAKSAWMDRYVGIVVFRAEVEG